MSRKLTKTIVITMIMIVGIVILLLLTPFIFKGKLMEIAKVELNKSLNARVDFKDLKLSFIRSFPDAYIALEGLQVTGVGDFEGEPLVSFDQLAVTVNIMSVIKMQDIKVKSILLDKANLNAHVLEDKRANWDIVKPKVGTPLAASEAVGMPLMASEQINIDPPAFSVTLNRFEIKDTAITYTDDSSKMKASIEALNFTLRGDMEKDKVDLQMNLSAKPIDFWQGSIHLLNQAEVAFNSVVEADMKNMDFVLKDNALSLNDIFLKLAGSVGLGEQGTKVDLTFETARTDFKSLLSLIPAIYKNNFKSVQTAGNLTLKGQAKGSITDTTLPIVDVELVVTDAMFKYPDLPKSVEKINIDLKAHYDGEVFDRTTVDLEKFSFQMAENPFNANLHVKTPESDMEINAQFNGKIDFNSLVEIVPMEGITLNGLLETSLQVAGKMSMIEQKRYEDFAASGMVLLTGFDFTSPAFAYPVKISKTQLFFTPRRVELNSFDATVASTDVSMTGSLENFIPFALKGDTVSGRLALRSQNVNLNEFMGDKEEKSETAEPAESTLSVIEVPKNVDFLMNINIAKVLFDKLEITDTTGTLAIKEGKVTLQNTQMNLLQGSMQISGDYSTVDIEKPYIDFEMNIRRFDIPSALSSFDMMSTFVANPNDYTGAVSATITLKAFLDEHLAPIMDTLTSNGILLTHNIVIHNSEMFGAIAEITKNEKWRTPNPDNMEIHYVIRDGRLWLEKPIEMNVHPAKIDITGDQGLDMTLHYRVTASMPISEFGAGATGFLASIPGGSNIREVAISGDISGTVEKPHVSLSIADMANSVKEAVTEAVKEIINEKVDDVKEQVNEEINRQIDNIMREANQQATNVRNTAKSTADRIRTEANASADRLIQAAANKNIIERNAAKIAADKLRSEGETAAKRAEQEGETQAQNIINAAQRRCDELRRS